MPLIDFPGPLTVSFFSQDCEEPIHVHVKVGDGSCKVWIDTWKAVQKKGLKPHQVNKIIRILKKNEALIRGEWNEHCCKEKK